MATKKAKQTQEAETQSVLGYFANLPDPRRNNENKRHQLIDIIAIAILATICGANHFTEMEQFGKANEDFLRSFLKLPNGIPSHDTIGEVFARLDASEFRKCFISWVEAIRMATEGETIAFDGKTMRRSYDRSGRKGALHMVSAWATRNRLTLGQIKVDEKSNEIKAIPELLRLLYVKGCIVTIDAIGTQKEIAEQIRQQEADYVLALKDNQPHLRAEVEGIFEAECAAQKREEKGKNAGAVEPNGVIETAERGHGRFESRRVYSIEAPEWLRHKERWRDLKSLIMVEATRGINDQVSIEKRYYISSLAPDANQANEVVRSHWGIENSLHWVLDVAFREDDLRVRVGNAPENLALVRKLTHNLLKQETSVKAGIQSKRLNAAWDRKYLLKILGVTRLTS